MASGAAATVREEIVSRLQEDLIGPRIADEALPSRASDIYLTGILWPRNTEIAPEENERLAVAPGEGDEGDDADDTAQPAVSAMRRPSTAGISFAARATGGGAPTVEVQVRYATYVPEDGDRKPVWRRRAAEPEILTVVLDPAADPDLPVADPFVPGLRLNRRVVRFEGGMLVTITLVNDAVPAEPGRDAIEKVTLFQVGLVVTPAKGTELIVRPSRRAIVDDDDRSNALLFSKAREYAVGHTCSADWTISGEGEGDGRAITGVHTTWLPQSVTPDVSGDGHPVFEGLAKGPSAPLSATWLSQAPASEAAPALEKICLAYEKWIGLQTGISAGLGGEEAVTAARHLKEAGAVLKRMRSGIRTLVTDMQAAEAFRLANHAMTLQREWAGRGPLTWRPFQIGFLLLTLESSIIDGHDDRTVMDLLWFPTGGGKTEAYLGLVAIVAFYRRLSRTSPDDGAGVAVVMRYTLRLLTTQQFVRASAMICACEVLRRSRKDGALGQAPFAIGLWVGEKATPNQRKKAFESQADTTLSSPRQLLDCPCCGKRLDYVQQRPSDPVTIFCRTAGCALTGGAPLPVWSVDEDIYAFCPTLLIGTVDKFAQIVRKQATSALFGVGTGAQPQLILQDELHLIAGPLGTVTGLYEAALDLIFSRDGSSPKIIGSTATIRGAPDQVLALFDRATCQFPPPGLSADDSGFAVTVREDPGHEGQGGRRYVGVTTAGRSAKFTLQAVAASLLHTATALSPAERDPYWTLITYFNSLRELGGALVLMQDDVHDSLKLLADSRSEGRRDPETVEELTSRLPQDEVREMLDRMEIPCTGAGALDVVLATNMLSVGVDIPRLGLMAVNGQPKTIAEYIQATSRVGRNGVRGLVVALLNNAKPRDRSHYETFRTWHETLYRDVEATSVTPFASRARDRALHAVLVAVVRHLIPGMLERPVLDDASIRAAEVLIDQIAARAAKLDPLETTVRAELLQRLRRWTVRQPAHYWHRPSTSLLQSAEEAAAKRAAGRAVGSAWPTLTSMRGVEPATPYRLTERLRGGR